MLKKVMFPHKANSNFEVENNPYHYHCPRCHSNNFILMNGEKVCKECNENGVYRSMIICNPTVCGSS